MNHRFTPLGLLALLILSGCAGSMPSAPRPVQTEETPRPSIASIVPDVPIKVEEAAKVWPPWPTLSETRIRPGIRMGTSGGSGCTTNFLFMDAANATHFLGTAAHCVSGLARDAVVLLHGLAGFGTTATLAYSSDWASNLTLPCGPSSNRSACRPDFALLRIHSDDRSVTHPAVSGWGGPVGVVNSTSLRFGDQIVWYGNSTTRQNLEPAKASRGVVVLEHDVAHQTSFGFVTPIGLFGDSGGPVLTTYGAAVGIVVGGAAVEATAVGLLGELDLAIRFLGSDLRLVTWSSLAAS